MAYVCVTSLNRPAQRQNYDDWLYELQWERSDRPQRNVDPASGTWIILDDSRAVGRGLRKRIEDAGGHCVSVVPAGSTVHGDFVVDPSDPEGFCAVLRAAPHPVQGIVHLWSLDNPTAAVSDEDIKRAENLTCSSTVRLIKDLLAARETDHPALWLVTNNVYAVTRDDVSISPLSALLWGVRPRPGPGESGTEAHTRGCRCGGSGLGRRDAVR
ncbi:KR prefix domain-containing protein [Kibdelosporangium aridum]|uniref:KR prefix domain-containing protein n=1 Tax=Kibdelosporangium aridum TaxID=2030 RepID=UPI0035EAA07F